MMEKKINVLADMLVEKVARIRVEQDSFRWPPICMGILHQPVRPVKKETGKC